MIRFSKIFLGVTIALVLLWQLPWCYNFLTVRPASVPFTLYSGLAGDFISVARQRSGTVERTDRAGNVYTQEQADSLLPFFYVRQLMSDERFPDTLMGVAVTPREVQLTNFTFRASAQDINACLPGLYPLLESMSGRVDLEMPDDVFRFTSEGIEFIDMKANSRKDGKSRLFTQTLANKGFCFPATCVAGNPTTRKEYDEGYLLLDAEGKLFHMKQMRGRPYVKVVELPDGVRPCHLFVTEFRSRQTRGLFTDKNHRLYVVAADYRIVPTGVDAYNPETDDLLIIGNMMDWTVNVRTSQSSDYYALRADDYSLIGRMSYPAGQGGLPGLHFTSSADKFVFPRL